MMMYIAEEALLQRLYQSAYKVNINAQKYKNTQLKRLLYLIIKEPKVHNLNRE